MRAAALAIALLLGLLATGHHAPAGKKHQPRKARETHRLSLQRPR